MADYTLCCNLTIYGIHFLDLILSVAGIIVWAKQTGECIPVYVSADHPDVPSHLLAIAILKIMIHIAENLFLYTQMLGADASEFEKAIKWQNQCFLVLHIIPLLWLCVVAFLDIDSATFQTNNHCINDIYIFSVIFTVSMVIMIISRIVLPIQECLCKM